MRSKWLDISQVLLSILMNRDIVEVHKNENKKQTKQKNRKEIAILNKQVWSKKNYCIAKRFFSIKNYLKPTVFVFSSSRMKWSAYHVVNKHIILLVKI